MNKFPKDDVSGLPLALNRLLRCLPKKCLATYQSLAIKLGNPRLARAVGNWLNRNRDPDHVPCFRVIKSNGEVGGFRGGQKEKIKRLKRAGFKIKEGKVVNYQKLIW